MNREELLETAEGSIKWGGDLNWNENPQPAMCALLHAIACVMLAKERREGETQTKVQFAVPSRDNRLWVDED